MIFWKFAFFLGVTTPKILLDRSQCLVIAKIFERTLEHCKCKRTNFVAPCAHSGFIFKLVSEVSRPILWAIMWLDIWIVRKLHLHLSKFLDVTFLKNFSCISIPQKFKGLISWVWLILMRNPFFNKNLRRVWSPL